MERNGFLHWERVADALPGPGVRLRRWQVGTRGFCSRQQLILSQMKYGDPPLKTHSLNRWLLGMGYRIRGETVHSEKRRLNDSVQYAGVSVRCLPWVGRDTRRYPLRFAVLAEAVWTLSIATDLTTLCRDLSRVVASPTWATQATVSV